MNRIQLLVCLLLMVVFVSCNTKKAPKKSTTQENTNPYGTYGGTYGGYGGYGGTNTWSPTPTPYVTVTPTATVNTNPVNPFEPSCDIPAVDKPGGTNYKIWCKTISKRGQHFWDASNDYNCGQNNCTDAFLTDSTFRFRVKALPRPSTCLPSTFVVNNNVYNTYSTLGYDKLRFDVELYLQGQASPFATYTSGGTFGSPLNVGQASTVITASVPGSQSNTPVIARVTNVRSNYNCDYWGAIQCPAEWPITPANCWSVELQIETDSTQTFAP